MTIKEQIEIARLIASGTPREVAILESSAIEKSGPVIDVDAQEVKTAQQKSVERQKALKGRQQEIKNRLTNYFHDILTWICEFTPWNKTIYVVFDEESEFSGPRR